MIEFFLSCSTYYFYQLNKFLNIVAYKFPECINLSGTTISFVVFVYKLDEYIAEMLEKILFS